MASLRRLARILFWTLILVGVPVGLIRAFVLRIWVVPSDDPAMSVSLAPTLEPGDIVLLLHAKRPGFGELVRCLDPDEPRRFVVGRVAAEGGDTLLIEDQRLKVNGTTVATEHACAKGTITVNDPNTGSPVELGCAVEALGSVSHMRATKVVENPIATPPISRTVQDGFVFLVSDNRFLPSDSRIYGAVPLESCDSRVIFRLWGAKGYGDTATRFSWIN